MGGAFITHDEKWNAYKSLVEKPRGMRLLRTSERRWEDNVKINLREVLCQGIEWIQLAQYRIQWHGSVNLRVS
jgi:hypothetical protein